MTMSSIRTAIAQSVVGGSIRARRFRDSGSYWEQRYASGGTSGAGSYGAAAQWKARVVNDWVKKYSMISVVDLGCGDGNQLTLASYQRYLGLDRSATAVSSCIRRFHDDPSKSFLRYDPETTSDPAGWLRADLALSLEVIFHLVEDDIREDYLRRLFASADRFVIICSSDRSDIPQGPHEHHRAFTPWVEKNAPGWTLMERIAPPAEIRMVSELFLYGRDASTDGA